MNLKTKLQILFFGVVIIDVLRYIGSVGLLLGSNSTFYIALIEYVSLFILLRHFYFSEITFVSRESQRIIRVWLLLLFSAILRGIILSENYWDWKYLLLQGIGFTMVSLFYHVGTNMNHVRLILDVIFRRLFPLGILLIPLSFLTNIELFSRVMISSVFLIAFIPYLTFIRKVLLLIVIFVSVSMVLDFRTLQIKIAIAFFLMFLIYILEIKSKSFLLTFHKAIFVLPFVFVFLSISYNYNVFIDSLAVDENSSEFIVEVNGNESNLLTDTRTFLYVETLESLPEINQLIFGKSIVGSYKSDFFLGWGGADENGIRYESEVGILNYLLKYGLLGVFLFLILIYRITYIGIKYGQNKLVIVLSFSLAFRWPLMFIEEYTQYDMNIFAFWIFMGLISNKDFQKMKDADIKKRFFNWREKFSNKQKSLNLIYDTKVEHLNYLP
jgi:hypothetical protein